MKGLKVPAMRKFAEENDIQSVELYTELKDFRLSLRVRAEG